MQPDRERELGSQALANALQSSFRLLQVAMIGMLIYILFTGVYIVKQHEVAIVLRLGTLVGSKADQIKQPGLHFGFPYPIDEVIRIPVERVLTVDSDTDWYKLTAEEQKAIAAGQQVTPPPSLRPYIDGYTLSGDANIMHSKWALRYQVVDPVRYALNYSSDTIHELLRAALDCAVLQVSARYTADAALRTDVDRFREDVQGTVSQIIDQEELGCSVQRVDIIDIAPPRQVKDAFDAVTAAEQDRSRLISEAQAYASQVVNQAEGQASQIVSQASAIRTRTVQEAAADADYFNRVLPQYEKDPVVVKKTLWLDTLQRVLDNVDDKWVARNEGELRLQLQRDPNIIAEESRKAQQQQQNNAQSESSADSSGAPAPPAPPSPPPVGGGQ